MTLVLGLLIIVAAVVAVIRRVDVRLALLLAAFALGIVAGDPAPILRTFLATLSNEQFVVPICSAMGFAYVLRHTQCDQHLVYLLVEPLRRVRIFLIPGAVLVGFLVNIPVISQTSTAVAIGAVLVPLLRAARISPTTTGAALLLGSSLGGELLNPGAPELTTVSTALEIQATDCVGLILPLLLLQLGLATALFWAISVPVEARFHKEEEVRLQQTPTVETVAPFRVNLFKAAVPLVPLLLLFLTALPRFRLVEVPYAWLVEKEGAPGTNGRLIGAAMLVGVVVAALASWRVAGGVARAFFEGAGYAFTHIISLIVTATCFGKGVELIRLNSVIGAAIGNSRILLFAAAGFLPLGFALISGSGFAATQSVFGLFIDPARALDLDPARIGAVVSIASAAGRTMSPVAAVTLMCASLTDTNPLDLVRRVALPLLVGMLAVVIAGILTA